MAQNEAVAKALNAINQANLRGAVSKETWQQMIEDFFTCDESEIPSSDSEPEEEEDIGQSLDTDEPLVIIDPVSRTLEKAGSEIIGSQDEEWEKCSKFR